jgi:hypothetical protein
LPLVQRDGAFQITGPAIACCQHNGLIPISSGQQ